jgi:hypothetical protein
VQQLSLIKKCRGDSDACANDIKAEMGGSDGASLNQMLFARVNSADPAGIQGRHFSKPDLRPFRGIASNDPDF